MNKPKTEFICVYILQTMKNLLFVCLFPPPYYFMETAAFPPPPSKHSPPQQCGVSSLMLLLRRLFSAFTNSARAIFVWGDSLLISLTHSLTNRFRDRKLQCALGLHLPTFLSRLPFSHRQMGTWGIGEGGQPKREIFLLLP